MKEDLEVVEKIWLPPRDSNPDMLIQSPSGLAKDQQFTAPPSEDSGKVRQNLQPPRNQKQRSGGDQ